MPEENETTDPNAQMVEPAISDDEMTQFLATLEEGFEYAPNIDLSTFQPKGASDNEDAPDDDTPNDDNGEEIDTPNETPSDDDTVTVLGKQFPRADIERLYQFDQFLRENPDKAQRVAEALASDGEPNVPTPAAPPSDQVAEFVPPVPPEDIDLDDPNTKFLWEQTVEARKDAWETRQQFAQTQQSIAQDRQAITNRQAQEDMAQALIQFKGQFPNLNEDDLTQIRNEAGPLVPAQLQKNAPVEALRRSMEIAAWANADIRSKLNDPAAPNPSSATKSTRRKQRLGSISGTPRSAPKVDSRPSFSSDREMVNELAQALADQGTGR